MPKPSAARIRKAQQACDEIVRQLRKHPEFEQHQPENDQDILGIGNSTAVLADVRFCKSGQTMFRAHPDDEDDDYPILVGAKHLFQTARDAAKTTKLKMTRSVRVYVSPNEKGWASVGYQFMHNDPPAA